MKKTALILSLFLLCLSVSAQQREDFIFNVASRIQVFLPETNLAQLEGDKRYIQIGILGASSDVDEIVGSFDRFMLHDKDMITGVDVGIVEEEIAWYPFYLSPLADANDFELMLGMHKIRKFKWKGKEYPIQEFSRTIYTWIKSQDKTRTVDQQE